MNMAELSLVEQGVNENGGDEFCRVPFLFQNRPLLLRAGRFFWFNDSILLYQTR